VEKSEIHLAVHAPYFGFRLDQLLLHQRWRSDERLWRSALSTGTPIAHIKADALLSYPPRQDVLPSTAVCRAAALHPLAASLSSGAAWGTLASVGSAAAITCVLPSLSHWRPAAAGAIQRRSLHRQFSAIAGQPAFLYPLPPDQSFLPARAGPYDMPSNIQRSDQLPCVQQHALVVCYLSSFRIISISIPFRPTPSPCPCRPLFLPQAPPPPSRLPSRHSSSASLPGMPPFWPSWAARQLSHPQTWPASTRS
jgi:hypothetical protein